MLSYNLFPFFALLLSFSVADNIPLEHVHDTFLDADKNFRLTWRYNTTHIEMQATARTTGWLALGLSPDGQMDNSDVFIAWVNDTTGEVVLQDRFLVSNRTSHQIIFDIDPQQDWMLIGGKQTNNETTVTAVRALVTCDTKFDRNFTRDTLRVIWSFHPLDPADPTRIPHHSRRGSKSLLMFSQAFEVRSQMMDGNKWGEMRIGMDPIAVSNTTASSYHCSMAKLPVITSDLHITGIRPQIKSGSEPFVQQISIYLCDERVHDGSIPKDFDCGNLAVTESEKAVKNQYCRTLIAVWFSGNGEYIYPSDAGILLSKENSGRYVLVQVHYDNNRKTDFNDNSGLLLSISNEIRTRNAGILATGLLQNDYPMTVPPGTEDFVITSSCMDYCTQSTIPATGIKIFNAAVNMHAKGRKIVVRVVRGAKIIDTVLSDDNIDPGYQEARQPETEITVLPGDRLIIECHYSTAKMKTPVFGGYGMEHESCLAFLYYYPAVNLTSCGSRIIARTFLETTGYIPTLSEPTSNPSVIEPFLEDADNSSLIRTYFSTKYDWSVGNVANLQYFYNSQKQIGVCSGNNGDEQRYNFIPPYENQPQKPESCIKTTNILLPKPQTITSGTKPNSGTSDKISSAAINLANNTVHNVRVGNGTIPARSFLFTTPFATLSRNSVEKIKALTVIIACLLSSVYAERLYGITTPRRRFGSGLASTRGDPNDQYVRVEAEIIKLTNDGGLTANNAYCDTFGSCDPVVYAHLDTDRPNAEWPGAVAVEYWPELFRVDNVNSPLINKKIKRDSCARPYKDAVLRVYAEDYDPASHNDQINQWQCPITRRPAESEVEAQWSPIADCVPKFHPGKMNSVTLTYRYRIFHIDRHQCDASLIASTPRSASATTPKSG